MNVPERPAVAERPPLTVHLTWTEDLKFRGQSGDVLVMLDSNAKDGTSPMQALAFALAGCMAMDLVHILTKARYAPAALRASLTGRRPADPPSRFLAIALHFEIEGDVPDDQVQRAIQLSRDKYCSVWNSMRQDIDLQVTFAVQPSAAHSQP
jgi:putative redox protein